MSRDSVGYCSTPGNTGGVWAVFLGALASGVNKSTWVAIKIVMIALVVVLSSQVILALYLDSWMVMLHVFVLTILAVTLFVLLSWFVAQTGLVSTEQQMVELGLKQE